MQSRREKGENHKMTDDKVFAQMWNAGISGREIAEVFGITTRYVYAKRKNLGLPKRIKLKWIPTLKASQYFENMSTPAQDAVIHYLQNHHGYGSCSQLKKIVAISTVHKMKGQGKLIRVWLSRNKGHGHAKRNISKFIFSKGYAQKVFYCLNRTAVVRLMRKALKKPATPHIQKSLTAFLRKYLTEAEKFAVLWHLGVRSYSKGQVSQSIQIDNVVKPHHKFSETNQ